MANHPRSLLIFDNATFHVTWKCHNHDWLLKSEFAKSTYYHFLLKYKDKYGVAFHSYCLMDNHPHLTGTCRSAKAFSDFFRVVNSCFAKTINKNLGRAGQVVMDRFKSPLIETGHDLLQVMFYNDLNPFRTKARIDPGNFKWSSYAYYAHGKEDPLLTDPKCYTSLGKTASERQEKYREMVRFIVENDYKKPKDKIERKPYSTVAYIGNPEWVKAKYENLRAYCRQRKNEWRKNHEKLYPS